jgi:hypothetical protein
MANIIGKAEKDIIAYLDKCYDEGKKYREEYSKEWDRANDILRGKIWPERRPSYKINATMNYLGQAIEKKVSLLTDSKPIVDIVPMKMGPNMDAAAEVIKKGSESIFDERQFGAKLTEFITLEQVFGLCHVKTPWDRTLDYGNGNVDIVVVDPRNFIFDPFIKRAYAIPYGEYCNMRTIRPTDYLAEKYPSVRDDIKADYSNRDEGGHGLLSKAKQLFGLGDTSRSSVVPRSIVDDWWLMDRQLDENDQRLYSAQRHIVVAGGRIVEDENNPYMDGEIPYDSMMWNMDIDSAYGITELSQLEMPQMMFNKLLATILENANLMSNAIWIGDYDALTAEDWKNLSNEPGQKVKVRTGRNLRRESGTALPSGLTQIATMLVQGLKDLAGDTEVSSGKKPGQLTSGVGVELLQLASTTAIRLKARQIEKLMERVGHKIVSRIIQFYTDDRVLAIVGETEHYKQYLFERNLIRKAIDEANVPYKAAYRLFGFKVMPDSSLSMVKWQKGMVATQLFQMGAVDRKYVLDTLEVPNRDEVLKRTIVEQMMGVEPMGHGKGAKQKQAKTPSQGAGGHQEQGMHQIPRVA